MATSLPSLVAVATGVLGSAWTAGNIANFSLIGVPTALAFPKQAVHIWYDLYRRGMTTMPTVAAIVGGAYAIAAYTSYNRREPWKGYLGAAGLVLSIVPFTLLILNPVANKDLIQAAQGASVLSETETTGLMNNWILVNLVRSLLPLTGAVVGASTFLSQL